MAVSSPSYFKNCFLLGYILGSGKHRFARFVSLLLPLIAVLVILCWANNILDTNHLKTEGRGRPIVGLYDDPLFIALCGLMPAAVGAILHLVKRLEDMFSAIPAFVTGSESPKVDARIQRDIKEIRSFISIETDKAKLYYRCWMCAVGAAFVFAQLLDPLVFKLANPSWALSPNVFPTLYVAACFWTVFWAVIVTGNVCWIVFSIVFLTFGMIIRYAREGSIFISPLISTERDGFSRVGDLAVANALLFTCGICVLAPFVLKFAPNKLGLVYTGAYFIVMIVIGVMPVQIVSKTIKKAQRDYLKMLGTLFNLYLRKLMSDLKRKGPLSTSDVNRTFITRLDRLAVINTAYARVEKMSTWPLPRVFASSIFSANAIAVLGTALSILKHVHDLSK